MPGATVSVSNNATGATREALTNETGAFRFSGLPPSSYSVTVEFPGFGTVTRPSVMLSVGGTTKVDFELDVGPITESITVTGAVPLVQPTENTVQVVVANQRVQELPSKSRDFMDLMLLSPGVTVDQSSARGGNSDSVSFYGMDERNKSVWLEGVDFNDEVTMGGSDISEATRTRLGQEAIQEFQVLSSGYSAEFGRTGSGAINVVVKSGGNDVHGSGFYFIRDDAFDKDPFQVVRGEAVPDANPPPFQTQQYGFTVGGPFVRQKAFYFGSIERRTDENSSQVTIPDSVKAFVDSLRAGYDTSSALPQLVDERNALGKFTFNLHPRHTLNIMYLYDDREFTNKQTGQANGADNGFDDVRSSYYATASLTSLIGNRVVNEFRANRSIQRLFRDLQASASGRFLPTLEFPLGRPRRGGQRPAGPGPGELDRLRHDELGEGQPLVEVGRRIEPDPGYGRRKREFPRRLPVRIRYGDVAGPLHGELQPPVRERHFNGAAVHQHPPRRGLLRRIRQRRVAGDAALHDQHGAALGQADLPERGRRGVDRRAGRFRTAGFLAGQAA